MKHDDPFATLPRRPLFTKRAASRKPVPVLDDAVSVTLRIPKPLMTQVDAFAITFGLTRSETIRRILAEWLA